MGWEDIGLLGNTPVPRVILHYPLATPGATRIGRTRPRFPCRSALYTRSALLSAVLSFATHSSYRSILMKTFNTPFKNFNSFLFFPQSKYLNTHIKKKKEKKQIVNCNKLQKLFRVSLHNNQIRLYSKCLTFK